MSYNINYCLKISNKDYYKMMVLSAILTKSYIHRDRIFLYKMMARKPTHL